MQNLSNNIELQYLGQNEDSQELIINNNYLIIDSLIYQICKDVDFKILPTDPETGDVVILSNEPNQEYEIYSNNVAIYNKTKGWTFIKPIYGMKFYSKLKDKYYKFSQNNQWKEFNFTDSINQNGNIDQATISYLIDRKNHTGMQLASTIENFQQEINQNINVSMNTLKRHEHLNKNYLDLVQGENTGDETTLSIQKKRPLKTINNQSLEGEGNISLTSQIYNGDSNFIGDYKQSAQKENHGKWLLCDGSFISRINYPKLFGLIGTSFGAGNNSTTFNLPDFRGRVFGTIGQGNELTKRDFGDKIGEERHTLTRAELPNEKIKLKCGGLSVGWYPNNNYTNTIAGANRTPESTMGINTDYIEALGSGESHNNMQPTLFGGNIFIYAD